jgi:hypothetical protein
MDLNKDNVVTPAEWQMMREMFDRAENAVLAIRSGGKSDLTKTHLAWKSTRSLPYVSSPLYFLGRLYTVNQGGDSLVLRASPKFEAVLKRPVNANQTALTIASEMN